MPRKPEETTAEADIVDGLRHQPEIQGIHTIGAGRAPSRGTRSPDPLGSTERTGVVKPIDE